MKKERRILTKRENAGFTLLETIVAVFVVTIGIGGAYAFLQHAITSQALVADRVIASYLAQEGLEIVRNIRDTNFLNILNGGGVAWDDGLTGCVVECFADYTDTASLQGGAGGFLRIEPNASGGVYRYGGGGSLSLFERSIQIVEPNTVDCPAGDCMEITVVVSWERGGNTNNVEAATRLYRWFGP